MVGATKPARARHFEGHLEVQGLALVDEVQRPIGVQLAAAVAHGGQVGGGIEIAATGLLHDHRQRMALGVLEFVEKDAAGAVALGEQAGGVQIAHHLGQVVVVGALALDVGRGQANVEAVVDFLAMGQGDGIEAFPEPQAVGIAGLQRHHQFARAAANSGEASKRPLAAR